MKNVQYTFVENEGNLTFRSTVNSFGLDHVTDKDLVSFYTNFSGSAYIDTGLLPVDGSGLLSIRSAGNHTQIAYQHKPGMYYINWGQYEGDKNATKYYVAQPYRIVIGDLLNGNIYGARTFYSPVPITYPEASLYHVNLPNINCKGYRGNGVGWICLYHTEDVTRYPFNEKVAKLIDRCSGTEAYNDNNMSETDGPRFYRDNNKPAFTWDPRNWENYSNDHGYDWTLDPDLWIPVLVTDKDNQDRHDPKGQPLTFVDAILGNYKCYYYDDNIPKPVNMIARHDLTLSSSQVFNWFKQSYVSSQTDQTSVDPYASSLNVRESHSVAPPVFSAEDEEDEDDGNSWYCEDCEETISHSDSAPNSTFSSNFICDSCLENYNYCENTQAYHYSDDVLYLGESNIFIYPSSDHNATQGVDYKYCGECDRGMYKNHSEWDSFVIVEDNFSHYCKECFDELGKAEQPSEEPF
jgi:hypothetical protein